MKLFNTFFVVSVLSILNISTFSQDLKPADILKQSQAELVVVGKIDGYGRTYNQSPSEYIDGTFATFRVLRILKGEYKDQYVEVRFPGHVGFSDTASTILFITSDMKTVVGDGKLGNCLEARCFYSNIGWTLSNTRKNITAVERLLRR